MLGGRIVGALCSKIKNMISWSRVTNIGLDDQEVPSGQIEYMDNAKQVVYVFPYGYSAQPILDGLAIKANVGSEEQAVAFPISWKSRESGLKQGEVAIKNGLTNTLIKFQEDGSLKIDSKNEILIDASGNITINAPATNSTTDWTNTGDVTNTGAFDNTGTMQNTGNVTINGNLTVTGSVSGLAVSATTALSGATLSAGGISASGGSLSATGDVTAGGISLNSHVHGGVTSGGSNTTGPV